jgi:predicted nucleic acid-binding protein
VWSLALRRKKGAARMKQDEARLVAVLTEGIKDGRVVIVGPVRQEILSGIKHVEQFEKILERLGAFPDVAIESIDYVQAARLDNRCREAGVQCGEVDMLLCAVADRHDWTVLTHDAGLIRCIKIIEREGNETNTNTSEERHGKRLLAVV